MEHDSEPPSTDPSLRAMSLEANPKAVMAFIFKEMSKGNIEIYESYYSNDFVTHDPARPDITGRDTYAKYMFLVKRAFPDLQLVIDDIIVEEKRIAVRWSASGEHQGDFFGSQPTGRRMQWSGMCILRVEQNRITEEWLHSDALGLSRQLGNVTVATRSIT